MYKGSMPDIALRSLWDQWWIFLSLLILVSIWQFIGKDRWKSWTEASMGLRFTQNSKILFISFCALFGLWRAWQLMWIGDDAFITLRYSDMFAQGEGLVFNRGEWVEGYTNFLWTLILGLVGKLGGSLPHSALIGNLLFFSGSIALTALICNLYRLSLWPAIVVSGSYPCLVFATSGLETMPAVFCVLLGVYFLTSQRYVIAGLGFIAAALMRPDHILFWGCGGLSLLITHLTQGVGPILSRLRWMVYARYTAALLIVYVPYFLWRMNAYGELFPNTYYAKSGHLSYWSQGSLYLSSFLIGSGVWWILLTLTIILVRQSIHTLRSMQVVGHSNESSDSSRSIFHSSLDPKHHVLPMMTLVIFCILSILIFTTYVVKVGGDFMLYRFFIVLIPLFWIALCTISMRHTLSKIALIVGVALALTPISLVKPMKKKWGLAAEETFYEVASFSPLKLKSRYVLTGEVLNLLNQETATDIRVAVDCVGMIGFYGNVRVFDLFGLTSPRIAHKPLKRRGRPGHEKFGTLNDALAEQTTFSTVDLWKRAGFKKMLSYTRAKVRGRSLYFLKFDPEIYQGLKNLKKKGEKVILPLSPSFAAQRIKREAKKGPNPKLLKFLRRYYSLILDEAVHLSEAIEALSQAKVVKKKPKSFNPMKPLHIDPTRVKPLSTQNPEGRSPLPSKTSVKVDKVKKRKQKSKRTKTKRKSKRK